MNSWLNGVRNLVTRLSAFLSMKFLFDLTGPVHPFRKSAQRSIDLLRVLNLFVSVLTSR